jgi:hypothetical protein
MAETLHPWNVRLVKNDFEKVRILGKGTYGVVKEVCVMASDVV